MGEGALTNRFSRRSWERREHRGGLGQIGRGTLTLRDTVSAGCFTGGGVST
jgi:hypothetical protein